MTQSQTPSPSSSEAPKEAQSLAQRGNNRSRQPTNQAFRDFIGSGWGEVEIGRASCRERV